MRAARELLLTLLTAVSVLIAVGSWSRITAGLSHAMLPIALSGVVVVAAGTLLRLTTTPRWAIVLVQLALAWSVVSIRLTHTPVPLHYAPRMRLENAFVAAGETALHAATPVPVIGGVLPFVLCGAALAFVVADLLARTLRLTAVAGIVLLAVLAVPISVMGSLEGASGAARSGVSPWLFALAAAGWLAQVVLAEGDRLQRWGRELDGPDPAPGGSAPASRSVLGTIAVGGTATALALVVPLAVPTMHLDFKGFGAGPGNGHVTVTNPMVDVQHSLVQGDDVPLVEVRTDDPDPSYLRLAVLIRFTATQWSAGDRSIPQDQGSHGTVPIDGLGPDPSGVSFPYRISVEPSFDSRWLPTPAPITAIEADGDWRYDTSTNDFVAVGDGLSTAGLTYSAVRLRHTVTADQLRDMRSGIGQVSARYTDLPADLPAVVAEQARRVTRDAATPLAQAVDLQTWFRSTGHFRYSTDVSLGSGGSDLATFLGTGPGSRIGYCQQYAAAMAAMARTLGIPARVAVGFLNPTRQTDGSYVFSSHDMHAWPELYFEGAGWVRFEPTPASGTVVPSYALAPGDPTLTPVTPPSPSSSTAPLGRQTAKPRADTNQNTGAAHAALAPVNRHPMAWLGGVLALALLAFLVALPGAVRRRRRRARLGGSAEDAWAELRDTVIDLGVPWADGVSPRATQRLLDRYLGTHDGHLALGRLVDALERERYAAASTPLDPQVLRDVLEGLRQGEPPTTVRRAAWWPRSVVRTRRLRAARTADGPADLDRVG